VGENEKGPLGPLLELIRPFTLLAPAVGFLSGAVIAGGWQLPISSYVGALAAVVLNAASNIINQCFDLEIDRINKSDRPLPAGTLSLQVAGLLGGLCYVLALILAYVAHPRLLAVFGLAAALTVFYSAPPLRLKRHALSSSIALGFARGCLLMVGGWGSVAPLWHPAPWFVGMIFGLYVFGASNTKDFADARGDRAFGIKTLPVLYGPRRAAWMVFPFLILPFLLIPIGIVRGWVPETGSVLILLAVWGGYVAWLMLKRPEALTIESNHVSWKHMYFLLIVGQIGFACVYALV
jgi:4-hydroxybenzoate polyprenyltransferase